MTIDKLPLTEENLEEMRLRGREAGGEIHRDYVAMQGEILRLTVLSNRLGEENSILKRDLRYFSGGTAMVEEEPDAASPPSSSGGE